MGKVYKQLSIEERTMIQTQLEMGIKPAAIAKGLEKRHRGPRRPVLQSHPELPKSHDELLFPQPIEPERRRSG